MWRFLSSLGIFLISKGALKARSTTTCDSQSASEPTSKKDLRSWLAHDVGAGARRQGHITATVHKINDALLVAWGGTATRNDDVTDVLGSEANVSMLNTSSMDQNWTTLTMVGGSPNRRPQRFQYLESSY